MGGYNTNVKFKKHMTNPPSIMSCIISTLGPQTCAFPPFESSHNPIISGCKLLGQNGLERLKRWLAVCEGINGTKDGWMKDGEISLSNSERKNRS